MNPQELLRYIQRLFAQQARKMRNVAARGVLRLVNDGLKMQACQVSLLDDELLDGAERPQNYGFTAHPHPGAEAFVVFCGADRAHPLILVADDRRFRVKSLEQGEVCIYTDEGDTITLKRGNRIEVQTKHLIANAEDDATLSTKACTINCKTFEVKASARASIVTPNLALQANSWTMSNTAGQAVTVPVTGSLKATQDVLSNSGAVSLNGHVHSGVERGPSNTDAPLGGA